MPSNTEDMVAAPAERTEKRAARREAQRDLQAEEAKGVHKLFLAA